LEPVPNGEGWPTYGALSADEASIASTLYSWAFDLLLPRHALERLSGLLDFDELTVRGVALRPQARAGIFDLRAALNRPHTGPLAGIASHTSLLKLTRYGTSSVMLPQVIRRVKTFPRWMKAMQSCQYFGHRFVKMK
jgi:hypothetical protein